MGLDSVELVMAIEDEFGLDIPDYAAARMYTVGDVYEYLKQKLDSEEPVACMTQRVFYKLRKALIENYGLKRSAILLDTKLSDIMPLKEIEAGWPFLDMFIELRTPTFQTANQKVLGFKLIKETLTMRELVDSLIALNSRTLAPRKESNEEIWDRLVKVFMQQLSVSIDEIKPEASITQDLGCD